MPTMRVLLAAAATLAALVAAGSAAAAPPPRDCVRAGTRGAPQALRSDVQRAKRVQLTRSNDLGTGNCMLLYVVRGKLKLAYGTPVASPAGQAGVWTAARALGSLGPKPACIRNVRVLRGGTLLPL
jgi:hypothetical protein